MGMNPDSAELLGKAAQVHLIVEEVGDGRIVEPHRGYGAALPHELNVFDQQQVSGALIPKPPISVGPASRRYRSFAQA